MSSLKTLGGIMSKGNPAVQVRMKPDRLERLEDVQEKIKNCSGEELPLATICRYAVNTVVDELYEKSDDSFINSIPFNSKVMDSFHFEELKLKKFQICSDKCVLK